MKHLYLLLVLFSTTLLIQANNSNFDNTFIKALEVQSSDDADLISLTTNSGYFCISFHPDSLYYELAMGPGITSIAGISAVPSDSAAVLTFSGSATMAPYGDLIITVTAEDNITFKVYTIHVVEYCTPNFDLVFLSDSNATWCDEFSSDQSIYYVQVDSSFFNFQILQNVSSVDTSSEVAVYMHPEDPEGFARIGVESQDSVVYYEVYFVETCPPLSIIETIESGLQFYPNPAKDIVNIHLDNSLSTNISLVGISGRVLETIDIELGQPDYQLDISKYPSGMYFIQVHLDGELLQSEKLIIE